MTDAPLPKRVGDCQGDVKRLNKQATDVSQDTYNYLNKLRLRLAEIQAEIDTIEASLLGLSNNTPIKVGGAPTAGVGTTASPWDHVHPITETGGPTNLSIAAIAASEALVRSGSTIKGIGLRGLRQNGGSNNATTGTPLTLTDLDLALKAATEYVIIWAIPYLSSGAGVGIVCQLGYTGAMGTLRFSMILADSATTMASASTAALNTNIGSGAGPGASVRLGLFVAMCSTTTAGTLSFKHAPNVAGSTTVQGGAYVLALETN